MSDDAVIVPPEGRLKETAQLLLSLAGDVPEIVRTTSSGTVFLVPVELADAYTQAVAAAPDLPKRRGRKPRGTTEE